MGKISFRDFLNHIKKIIFTKKPKNFKFDKYTLTYNSREDSLYLFATDISKSKIPINFKFMGSINKNLRNRILYKLFLKEIVSNERN